MVSTSILAETGYKGACRMILMSGVGERVKARRTELGYSQSELARRAGGISYQAVQQLEAGGGSKHLVAIAKALGVSAEWLAGGTGAAVNPSTENDTSTPSPAAKVPTDNLIRVLGMAECGPDGESLWNGDVVDYVPRPPNLAGATRAYAVFAQGTSMEPRYHAGELVYIHPDKPVTPGCYVLVQLAPKEDGQPPRAFLKRLVKRSGVKIVLQQFEPAKNFEIKSSDVVSMHRVVGSGEA